MGKLGLRRKQFYIHCTIGVTLKVCYFWSNSTLPCLWELLTNKSWHRHVTYFLKVEWVLILKLMKVFLKIHTYTMHIDIFPKTLKGHFYVLLGYQSSVKINHGWSNSKDIELRKRHEKFWRQQTNKLGDINFSSTLGIN